MNTFPQLICHEFRKDIIPVRIPLALWFVLVIGIIACCALAGEVGDALTWANGFQRVSVVAAALILARVVLNDTPVGDRSVWKTRPAGWKAVLGSKLLLAAILVAILALAIAVSAVVMGGEFSIGRYGVLNLIHGAWWALPVVVVCSFARSFRQAVLFLLVLAAVLHSVSGPFEGIANPAWIFPVVSLAMSLIAGVLLWGRPSRKLWALVAVVAALTCLLASLRQLPAAGYSGLSVRRASTDWIDLRASSGGMFNDVRNTSLEIPIELRGERPNEELVDSYPRSKILFFGKDGGRYNISVGRKNIRFPRIDLSSDPRQYTMNQRMYVQRLPEAYYRHSLSGRTRDVSVTLVGNTVHFRDGGQYPIDKKTVLSSGSHHRVNFLGSTIDSDGEIKLEIEELMFFGGREDLVAGGLLLRGAEYTLVDGDTGLRFRWAGGGQSWRKALGVGALKKRTIEFRPWLDQGNRRDGILSFENAVLHVMVPELTGFVDEEIHGQGVELPPSPYSDDAIEF